MARHKDYNWDLPEGSPNSTGGRVHQWAAIHSALLMDLRDELRRLNALLHCSNFQGIPRRLAAIEKNTTKRKYVRKTEEAK